MKKKLSENECMLDWKLKTDFCRCAMQIGFVFAIVVFVLWGLISGVLRTRDNDIQIKGT